MPLVTPGRRSVGDLFVMRCDIRTHLQKGPLDRRMLARAARQKGAIGRQQLIDIGYTKSQITRRRKGGTFIDAAPGVYLVAGSPSGWERDLWVAHLWAGTDTAISHRAAAAAWGLAARPREIDVCYLGEKRKGCPGIKTHYTRLWLPGDICERDGLTLTSPTRTMIDIAGIKGFPLSTALDEALRRKLVSIPRLEMRLDRISRRGRRGVPELWHLLQKLKQGSRRPRSELERRFFECLVAAGLPRPIREHRIEWEGKRFYLDFAFPYAKIAVEADSYEWHTDPSAWKRDLGKRNAAAALGWTLLHSTWADLADRNAPIYQQLRQLLFPTIL